MAQPHQCFAGQASEHLGVLVRDLQKRLRVRLLQPQVAAEAGLDGVAALIQLGNVLHLKA